MKKNTCNYFWLSIFGICFLAFQSIQDIIRPDYSGDKEAIKYLLGVAPNFFPAIGIPALFMVLLPYVFPKYTNYLWLRDKRHVFANSISVTGLLGWEFLQGYTENGHFDWNDVIWTIVGAILFYVIWKLSPNRFKFPVNQ